MGCLTDQMWLPTPCSHTERHKGKQTWSTLEQRCMPSTTQVWKIGRLVGLSQPPTSRSREIYSPTGGISSPLPQMEHSGCGSSGIHVQQQTVWKPGVGGQAPSKQGSARKSIKINSKGPWNLEPFGLLCFMCQGASRQQIQIYNMASKCHPVNNVLCFLFPHSMQRLVSELHQYWNPDWIQCHPEGSERHFREGRPSGAHYRKL